MVDVDVEAVRAAMQGDTPEAAVHRRADRWRERLLEEGDAALAALVEEVPGADRQRLRALVRRAGGGAPGAARALFDALVDAIAGSAED